MALIFSFFAFATSRLCAVRSNRSRRRHLLTCVLTSLHMPMDFHKKPRAWHSSSAFMISSHPNSGQVDLSRVWRLHLTSVVFRMKMGMHGWLSDQVFPQPRSQCVLQMGMVKRVHVQYSMSGLSRIALLATFARTLFAAHEKGFRLQSNLDAVQFLGVKS